MTHYNYVWKFGEHELVGHNNAWLRSACRERNIKVFSLTRAELIKELLDYGLER